MASPKLQSHMVQLELRETISYPRRQLTFCARASFPKYRSSTEVRTTLSLAMISTSNASLYKAQLDEATLFINGTSLKTEQDIIDWLSARFLGLYPGISNVTLIREILKYYPDSPAAGSPYGTGNETFGLGAEYKRLASLMGDLAFQVT